VVIDRCLLPAGPTTASQRPAAACGGFAAVGPANWTDRRMDTVPFRRPSSAYCAGCSAISQRHAGRCVVARCRHPSPGGAVAGACAVAGRAQAQPGRVGDATLATAGRNAVKVEVKVVRRSAAAVHGQYGEHSGQSARRRVDAAARQSAVSSYAVRLHLQGRSMHHSPLPCRRARSICSSPSLPPIILSLTSAPLRLGFAGIIRR